MQGPDLGSRPGTSLLQAERTKPLKRGQAPAGKTSFPSSTVPSRLHFLGKGQAGPGSRSQRLQRKPEPPRAGTRFGEIQGERGGATGVWSLRHTPLGIQSRREKGMEANGARRTHSAADSQRAADAAGETRAAAAAAKAERPGCGRGRGGGDRQMRMRPGRPAALRGPRGGRDLRKPLPGS